MARNRHGGGPRDYAAEPRPKRFWHCEALFLVLDKYVSENPAAMHRGCEIGVYLAHLSEALCERYPTLHMSMVDPYSLETQDWPKSLARSKLDFLPENMVKVRDAAAKRMQPYVDAGMAQWFYETSAEAAPKIADESLDFAFIDASHTYEDCKADLQYWWPKIKRSGFISGHDFVAHRSKAHRWGVTRAVNEFAAESGLELVLGDGKTYYFHKPAE